MGAKQSTPTKPTCPECNCESEVPRVIAACDTAANKATGSTLTGAMDSLLGQDNAAFLMNEYQNLIGNTALRPDLAEENKWSTYYFDKTRLGFTNLEGLDNKKKEEECIPCDCVEAADNIINNCQNGTNDIPNAVQSIISDGGNVMSQNTENRLNSLFSVARNENTEPINNEWANLYYQNIITREVMTNIKESFRGLPQFTRDALNSRHATFKNTAKFQEDCTNNSYNSIKTFIREEKTNLDNLYNYYVTFVKDYESLYLHKESVRKIIYNKMDELEKIQTKIDSYKTNIHVDNRKNNYQTNNYDFYSNIRFYLLIVYYSLFILYLIFSNFISLKQYNNKKLLLLLFIYLIIPVILSYLINLTYEGYIYYLEYNNYKQDTKSYDDIVNGK